MGYPRNEIDSFIDGQVNNMIRDVQTLVRIPSVDTDAEPGCPYGQAPKQVLLEAKKLADLAGFSNRIEGDRILEVDFNELEPALGVVAHLDVVDAGIGWTDPPYELTVRDGLLIGRGTADNKCAVVSALYALKALKNSNVSLGKGVRLLFGTAEETGCSDLKWYQSEKALPPMTFTPDAHYPVINAEKGMHMPKFSQSWEQTDVLPRVHCFHGGSVHNAVPAVAEAEIYGLSVQTVAASAEKWKAVTSAEAEFDIEPIQQGVRIRAKGKAAHVCEPYLGENAQTALISLLNMLPLAECGSTAALRNLEKCFPHGDIRGAAFGVQNTDEIFGELYLSFSVLQMDESGLAAQYDCRCPAACTQENTADVIICKLTGCGFTITEGEKMTPTHFTDPDSPLCRTLNSVYEEYTGLPGGCLAIGGFTYLHDVPGGVAFGCAFPGENQHCHTAQEFFPIEDMLISAKMFAKAIFELCQ